MEKKQRASVVGKTCENRRLLERRLTEAARLRRYRERVKRMPAVRAAKVERMRREWEAGTYLSEGRLKAALEHFLLETYGGI